MPYSALTFDDLIVKHLTALNPKSILDIGAGAGKYGTLLRSALPDCKIDAVEPTRDYIDRFDLRSIYNTVFELNIDQYLEIHPKNRYDVVIIGDMLEHVYRSKVVDYLDFLLYKNSWVLCIWPTNYPQDDFNGNGYECHRSNFKLKDLADKFEIEFFSKKFLKLNVEYVKRPAYINYCVMKGLCVEDTINFLS
jgi:AdoMet dependent proline di-methyltransferase